MIIQHKKGGTYDLIQITMLSDESKKYCSSRSKRERGSTRFIPYGFIILNTKMPKLTNYVGANKIPFKGIVWNNPFQTYPLFFGGNLWLKIYWKN